MTKPYQPIRLRILPDDNHRLPTQDCERLKVRLSIAACGARWRKAETQHGRTSFGEPFISCVDCPVGEANRDWLEARATTTTSEREGEPARRQSRAHARPRWSPLTFGTSQESRDAQTKRAHESQVKSANVARLPADR